MVLYTDDRVLLTSRRGQSWYVLPGGPVAPGETVEASPRRHVEQGAGVDIDEVDFVGVTEHVHTVDGLLIHEVNLVFAARLPRAAQIVSNDPDLRLTSVRRDRLSDLRLRPATLADLVMG